MTRRAALLSAHPGAATLGLLLFASWAATAFLGYARIGDLLAAGATIATLTIALLLQHAQNHDTRALHAKLDELILTLDGPRDEIARIEERAADELEELRKDPDL